MSEGLPEFLVQGELARLIPPSARQVRESARRALRRSQGP